MVYTEASEEGEEEGDVQLPEPTGWEVLICKALLPEQHFTEPPARYSESSLIKELEKNGTAVRQPTLQSSGSSKTGDM